MKNIATEDFLFQEIIKLGLEDSKQTTVFSILDPTVSNVLIAFSLMMKESVNPFSMNAKLTTQNLDSVMNVSRDTF